MTELNISLYQIERNCWRLSHCDRLAILIDGDEYFSAVREAIKRAQRSVYIVGWDIDSRTRLGCKEPEDEYPHKLGDFLHAVLNDRSDLDIYILTWDFSVIYTFEREWQPLFNKPDWRHHRRLHFIMDDQHPVTASHHQKLVTVDDKVAFSGGFDLSKWRLDRSAHRPDEPCRRDPDNKPYPPFHDIQMLVAGQGARDLSELCRQRWKQATGQKLRAPKAGPGDVWPRNVEPVSRDIAVAISRTLPQYRKQREVREVEQLYFDTIEAARDYIYIENQYFTSTRLADVFERSLQKAQGPEIILVLPERTGGWLEQTTMDVIRGRLLQRLVDADEHQRLRIVYPHIGGLGDSALSVHSKLMIADDRLLRVGSANLSNRSMGLDSECDLSVVYEADEHADNPAITILCRLLGEHLGCDPSTIAAQREQYPSLRELIDALDNDNRALKPLDYRPDEELDRQLPDSELIDPERPISGKRLMNTFIGPEHSDSVKKRVISSILIILALFTLAAVWRWTPLSQWLNPSELAAALHELSTHPLSPVIVIGGFVIGALVAIPVSFLIIVTGLLYGMAGFFYALLGSIISASISYYLGARLGRETIRKVGHSSINRLSRRLARKGVLTMITVRVIPVAPFIVINVVAGASHIRFRDYFIGTLVGMTPGIFMLTTFVDQLLEVVRQADLKAYLVFGAIVIALVAGMFALRRWLERRSQVS